MNKSKILKYIFSVLFLCVTIYSLFNYIHFRNALSEFKPIVYSYIEKITNTLGTFLVNMVCFTDVQNSKETSSNQLKFIVELISFPPNFVKDNSIFTIG